MVVIYKASGIAGGIQQVPDPEAERVQRLEQELKDLREALTMRQVQGQDPLTPYGAQPFQRMGPQTANPGMTQWKINQACQDVNMRDWIHVNAGQPNLQQRANQPAGNLCGGGRVKVNQVGYLYHSRGVLPLLVCLMMIGIEKKNSSR